jgi:hypothetical protein
MNKKIKILITLFFLLLALMPTKAQETVPATGGTASGNGGSVTYTVGQVLYITILGTNGTVIQGVQQPYEISVATAVEETEGITLEFKVFPNPTTGKITLTIEDFDIENLKYILFGINGILLQEKNIENRITEISMENLSPSVYFLKVIKDNMEIKTFKIIKK